MAAGGRKPRTFIKWEPEATFDTEEAALAHARAQGYVHFRSQHGARVLKCAAHVECYAGSGALVRINPVPGGSKARFQSCGLHRCSVFKCCMVCRYRVLPAQPVRADIWLTRNTAHTQ